MATCLGNFSELSKQLQQILIKIIENENIAKLLEYKVSDRNDPAYDPLSQPIVDNPYKFLNTQVWSQTYKPPTDTQTVYICVFFTKFRKSQKNPYFKSGRIYVNIACHRDLWTINNGIRVYEIMHEIDSILNRGDVTGSVSKDWFEGSDYMPISDLYNSMSLEYQFYDS